MSAPQKIRCTARSSRTGEPCKHWAMKGQTVCQTHGGKAPQNLAAAQRRLEAAVPNLITELLRIGESGKAERDRISAIRDALDRAGFGVKQEQTTPKAVIYEWPE